jgi:AcrR family transcriptional regulator
MRDRSRTQGRARHLPNGPHELTPEQVAENQTARTFAALSGLVSERGYEHVTVGLVIARAGISRKTFYNLRGGLEPWFVALCDTTAEQLLARIENGAAQGRDRAERIDGAVGALIEFAVEDPARARTCFVETLAAGPKARAWRDTLIDRIVEAIASAASRQPDAGLAARATVGAVIELAVQSPEDLDRDHAAALVARMLSIPSQVSAAA